MLDIPTFLMRWLFLSSLLRDAAEELQQADRIIDRITIRQAQLRHPVQDDNDNTLDADTEIMNVFERKLSTIKSTDAQATHSASHHDATEVAQDSTSSEPTESEILSARRLIQDCRDFLPQLASAALKSPGAYDPYVSDPLLRLRRLLLRRCLRDPSWGIELCWQLEAEVGKAWKTLFEHRQQTGRRLIVVLPAEKAIVLAKIGSEKRDAFDLLQEAEQATAYGYTSFDDENSLSHTTDEHHSVRLPSSIGLRRCSHFGDTMHLIDRLTKVSSDLRRVPAAERESFLFHSLSEINRRIRRRMASKGDISLDVEDFQEAYGWPQLTDLTTDDIQYSVHLPLRPQAGTWPSGDEVSNSELNSDATPHGVVRVLNIVVSESRILASRERCPFLIHVEVIDTGIAGHDARLYAAGPSALGSTVEEAIGVTHMPPSGKSSSPSYTSDPQMGYKIPPELLQDQAFSGRFNNGEQSINEKIVMEANVDSAKTFPRGGWQHDDFFPDNMPGGYSETSIYDDIRQRQFEQLHQELHHQPLHAHHQYHFPRPRLFDRHPHDTGKALLDKTFGAKWSEKCREIRASSPYGHLEKWRLASFILKAGEDIRKEELVMQVISKLLQWFQEEIPIKDRPYMRPYTIMCVGGDAGLIECLSDAKSVDEVKKRTDDFVSLRSFFERAFPRSSLFHSLPEGVISFETAQDNFLRSLVGYSVVCYILQIKDRHNANILLDRQGHIMHIDFGFVLGETPKMGKVPIFSERAPFKLSTEFWDVLGGWNLAEGGLGVRFCKMFELAFACASRHADEIAGLVESTMLSLDPNPRNSRLIANGP
ncbi:hypothetical protein FisN_1Lh411 [Fistulifera solaris]|uniref:PI3K/PI4K catalytic domain-containing protein n=1 Tax=Fistulifera solaris TaxID=1519565 RepID=A0A1Z5K3V5_FISSO|nr:hypothetical protein FisN_1Lh411 [Fistulifera solaris]|eukprot:GAX20930.1 hypothetical protein FisN_1Lh411 [Fistulifera solaris]